MRVIDGLGLPAEWWGAFLLTQGVGGIAAALIATRISRRVGAGGAILLGAACVGVGVIAIGTPSLFVAGAGFFVSSFGVLLSNVHTMSVRQSIVPGELLGRVHGTWRTLMWGAMPIGALIGGAIGRIDLAMPFVIGGGAYLLVTVIFARQIARISETATQRAA